MPFFQCFTATKNQPTNPPKKLAAPEVKEWFGYYHNTKK